MDENSSLSKQRGLLEAVSAVDTGKDLVDYILAHQYRVLPNQGSVDYEKDPVRVILRACAALCVIEGLTLTLAPLYVDFEQHGL